MATVKDSIPHVVRTAHEPRQDGMWTATLSKIEQINSTIRLLRLSLPKDGVGALAVLRIEYSWIISHHPSELRRCFKKQDKHIETDTNLDCTLIRTALESGPNINGISLQ